MEHGHLEARFYSIAMIRGEADIITTRVNRLEVTRATLNQLAMQTIFSPQSFKDFKEHLTRLNDG